MLRNAGALADIAGVLVHGRFDLQAPLANAWALKRAWPRAVLEVVDNAGHNAGHASLTGALIQATDRFAAHPA